MAKIVRHKNEQVNTKVRIWKLNPDKGTMKYKTPVFDKVKTKTTRHI